MRENLVITSAYDGTPTVRTDVEGRGKKSQYGREGNPGCVPAFRSLSICSVLWDNYSYFLPIYLSAATFKRSYSNAY